MLCIQSKLQASFMEHWFWLKALQSTSCPKVVLPHPAKAIAIIASDLRCGAAIFAGCLFTVAATAVRRRGVGLPCGALRKKILPPSLERGQKANKNLQILQMHRHHTFDQL